MTYKLLLFLSISFNVIAQIILKYGALGQSNLQTKANFLEKITAMISPFFIAAAFFYGMSLLAYTMVLSKLEISKAYPISVVSAVVLVMLISFVFFQESVSTLRIIGIFLAILGVILIFQK